MPKDDIDGGIKMIIRITGGIGNQMFQYAFKKKLDGISKSSNFVDLRYYEKTKVHNGYELESVFSINERNIYIGDIVAPSERNPLLYKLLYKLQIKMFVTKNYIMEVLISYFPNYSNLSGNRYYLDGYWQSEDYFKDIAEEVRTCFTFPEFTEYQNLNLEKQLAGKNSVAIHVRRGDFLSASKFVCLGKTNYYVQAIEYIKKQINNPVFVVLSDDIVWCRENLNLDCNTIFVDWNEGRNSYRDMQIMSLCCHNIIANSSFSWWGAWLNANPKKIVVAPYRFYYGTSRDETHLLPEDWVKIQYDIL